MSRQLEQKDEMAKARQRVAVIQAVYGGLDRAVRAQDGVLAGFSAKLNGGDCLLTIRAVFSEGSCVCFVGAEDLPGALCKAVKELYTEELGWRQDKYAK